MRKAISGLLVAVALTACGGSDSDGEDARKAATSSDGGTSGSDGYVSRVDALCRTTRPRLVRVMTAVTRARDESRAGRAGAPETFSIFARELRTARTITEGFGKRLRALDVPRDEKTFHASLLDAVDNATANLDAQVRAARAHDAVKLRELSIAGTVLQAKSDGLLTGHGGFRSCGRSASD